MNITKKKIISIISAGALLMSFMTMANAEEGKIYINDTVLENAQIVKDNNVDLIPLRAVCESLGFEVNWINESRTIEIVKMPIYITCTPDADGYTFSRTAPMLLGVAPSLINDTTYVPTNFVDEILKGTIANENGNYKITYGEATEEIVTENIVTGTVAEIIIEDEKIVQLIIGDSEDVNSQIALNLSEELAASVEELGIVIGSEISAVTTGIQTMSIPPQEVATAIALVDAKDAPVVEGTVCDMIIEDEKLVKIVIGEIENPETQTILNLTDEMAEKAVELNIQVGSKIIAEVEDLATLSIPPQMIPVSLDVLSEDVASMEIEGKICELVYEDDKLVQIVIGEKENPMTQTALNLTEELANNAVEMEIAVDKTIKATVSQMSTRSIPPQHPVISIDELK